MVAWRNSVLLKIRVLSQANVHRWIQMSFRSFLPVVISIVCDAEHQRITITTFWNNLGKTLSEVIIFHATIGIILNHNFIITVYLKCFTLVFTNHSYGLSFTPFVRTSWSFKPPTPSLLYQVFYIHVFVQFCWWNYESACFVSSPPGALASFSATGVFWILLSPKRNNDSHDNFKKKYHYVPWKGYLPHCISSMFNLHVFEHEEFSLHQKRWKTSKYSEPVKTI